jgi:hypothetical protein
MTTAHVELLRFTLFAAAIVAVVVVGTLKAAGIGERKPRPPAHRRDQDDRRPSIEA